MDMSPVLLQDLKTLLEEHDFSRQKEAKSASDNETSSISEAKRESGQSHSGINDTSLGECIIISAK